MLSPATADRTETKTQSCGWSLSSTATGSKSSSFFRTSSPCHTSCHLPMTRLTLSADAFRPTSRPTVLLPIANGKSKSLQIFFKTSKKNSNTSSCNLPCARASSERTFTCQRPIRKTLPPRMGPNTSLPRFTASSIPGCNCSGINAPNASCTAGMCNGCNSNGSTSSTPPSHTPTRSSRLLTDRAI